ncbi:helix-turn-helix transcriptional regulator [Salinicoccus sp. ID82-1]|uniref:helix-turn-helix domain-containing protein n=1 Tax=Salinicoccus sp. ID82-1 TaxID=2820269 RepID=UPI001F403E42|nr:helix-turn-helix transcriptional regulator [Salinicoccus sp. ID82-1]MCG1008458.1 helix-turn-helix transcriptional regulator [Salinicoccus sp. ID82-1]
MELGKVFNPEEWGVSDEDQKIIELITQLESERKRLKMTQKEVADLSGITQGQLSRIENLESLPSFGTINKIARALNKELILS